MGTGLSNSTTVISLGRDLTLRVCKGALKVEYKIFYYFNKSLQDVRFFAHRAFNESEIATEARRQPNVLCT